MDINLDLIKGQSPVVTSNAKESATRGVYKGTLANTVEKLTGLAPVALPTPVDVALVAGLIPSRDIITITKNPSNIVNPLYITSMFGTWPAELKTKIGAKFGGIAALTKGMGKDNSLILRILQNSSTPIRHQGLRYSKLYQINQAIEQFAAGKIGASDLVNIINTADKQVRNQTDGWAKGTLHKFALHAGKLALGSIKDPEQARRWLRLSDNKLLKTIANNNLLFYGLPIGLLALLGIPLGMALFGGFSGGTTKRRPRQSRSGYMPQYKQNGYYNYG